MGLECDLTDRDKAILSKLDSPKYSLVRYNDLLFLKLVFKTIAENISIYIDLYRQHVEGRRCCYRNRSDKQTATLINQIKLRSLCHE